MPFFRNGRLITEDELSSFMGNDERHAQYDARTLTVGTNKARRNKTQRAMRELTVSGRNPVWGGTRSRNSHYR
jgi:hypothetical protein